MNVRAALALLSLPLCAFSCVSTSSLIASPTWLAPGQQRSQDLVDQYSEVQRKVDAWAENVSLYRRECSNHVPTPLCKSYVSGPVTVTVKVYPESNDVSIQIVDATGGSRLNDLERSLRAALALDGRWSVRDRYAKQ